ncbi:MAG TPA: hypothetical protein PK513_06070 [Alphaproteobacteria bacterium]|nr:hypothetical protein [Alphaproteobacteria bacterium]USO05406.1 MAG: hypothetical protein H6859_09735 [Rhodospirillales bacterium]HOO82048.1 hypothetical protein [Alphaproteobacteria bacterium]
MKKFAATLCIAGTAIALSACDTTKMGDVDTAPPYASERTAGYASEPAPAPAPAPAERVFREYQTK